MRSKEMKNEGRQLGIESCWLSTEGLWHFHPTLTIGIFWMGCQCGLRGRAHAPTHSSWFSPVGSGPSLTIFDGCCLLQPNLMARVTWRQDRILGRGKGRRDLWPNVMPNSWHVGEDLEGNPATVEDTRSLQLPGARWTMLSFLCSLEGLVLPFIP